ncbi:hypothetical protein BDA96_04G015800 [Sorghum bicolor]|uniref:Uncharacterized protein n=1 Tax=Sorghum bicolor TaxID=4558 RepID=A0A921R152_SORBI|nr:hypothetical protein BDA96_04G015800 [Sorghum bicolor]
MCDLKFMPWNGSSMTTEHIDRQKREVQYKKLLLSFYLVPRNWKCDAFFGLVIYQNKRSWS